MQGLCDCRVFDITQLPEDFDIIWWDEQAPEPYLDEERPVSARTMLFSLFLKGLVLYGFYKFLAGLEWENPFVSPLPPRSIQLHPVNFARHLCRLP